jgi:hypothetical protein
MHVGEDLPLGPEHSGLLPNLGFEFVRTDILMLF